MSHYQVREYQGTEQQPIEYPVREYQVIVTRRMVKGVLYPDEVLGTYPKLSIAADIAEKLVHRMHKGGIEREVIVWNEVDHHEVRDRLFVGCMCEEVS